MKRDSSSGELLLSIPLGNCVENPLLEGNVALAFLVTDDGNSFPELAVEDFADVSIAGAFIAGSTLDESLLSSALPGAKPAAATMKNETKRTASSERKEIRNLDKIHDMLTIYVKSRHCNN